MKLKNKKTGEIIETDFDLSISIPDDEKLYGCDTYTQLKGYTSLAELNEEWEDYEEPEMFYWIDYDGKICKAEIGTMDRTKIKQIGNYFNTREEAEKAVEKLKAFKRLKDKGLKAFSSEICGDDFVVNFKLTNHTGYSQSIDDFDCIFDFGGEE